MIEKSETTTLTSRGQIMPKFENFDNIIKKGRHFASKKGIKPEDVSTAIDEYRIEKNR